MIVAILGAGGHGHDIADIAFDQGYEVAFYDDGANPYPRLCEHGDTAYVAGVNDPHLRKAFALGPTPTRLVHSSATISPTAVLSPGVVVGPGSRIGPSTVLGPHVHVGPNCSITRTTVGAYTTISPGVDIAGDVTIGDECWIGLGSKVSNLLTIGDRAVIGCGAVVITNVDSDEIVAGVPAKPLQRREQT